MLRTLIIPTIIVSAIGFPFVWSAMSIKPNQTTPSISDNGNSNSPFFAAGYAQNANQLDPSPGNPFKLAGTSSINTQNSPVGMPFQAYGAGSIPAINPARPPNHSIRQNAGLIGGAVTHALPVGTQPAGTVYDENGAIISSTGFDPELFGMTPDFGAAETTIVPGTAVGPDLTAPPMEFVPVGNFAEVFQYGGSPQWIQNRWPRVSNAPGEPGLRGLRVALVTGTNSWDLHGSLTYYFDAYQKCQRVTFRGWTGDATRLIQLLQQNHGFKAQPTKWAGFYLSKNRRQTTGGLLMQNPTVVYAKNRVQRVGLVLELNQPKSKHGMSADFASLIKGATNSQ